MLATYIAAILFLACVGLCVVAMRSRQDLHLLRSDFATLKASAEVELRNSNLHRIACSNTDDGLVIQGLDGRIRWVNPAYCRIMGYPAEEVLGRNPLEFAMRPEDKLSAEAIEKFQYNRDDPNWGRLSLYRSVRKNGEEFWNQIRVSFHEDDDGKEYVILVCRDVSNEVDREKELQEKSAELEHVAAHDVLTGVANRARMMQFTNAALEKTRENGSSVGLLQIDLDKFKQVNDTYGHSAGDAVLRHISDNISKTLRKTDLLARMGGDEFVAVCTQFSSADQLKRLGVALIDSVKTPLIFEGHKIVPSISIGAVLSDSDSMDVDELLKKADIALYEVKRAGRGHIAVYDTKLHQIVQRKSRRSDELQRAILNDQITFDFQPTIEVATGRVCALEALARWKDGRGVDHLPSEFLEIARDLGSIADIDNAAMQTTIELHSQIIEADIEGIKTGFNASEDFLLQQDCQQRILSKIQKHGIAADQFRIELPQSLVFAAQSGEQEKRDVIEWLHEKGFATMLDSFGAGFAALLQIGSLNMAGFKTSLELTRGLAENPSNQKALRMINELAADMSLSSIVLGIESQAAYDALLPAGVRYAQGNWLAKPIPSQHVIGWLKQHQIADGSANILHPQLPPDQRIAI